MANLKLILSGKQSEILMSYTHVFLVDAVILSADFEFLVQLNYFEPKGSKDSLHYVRSKLGDKVRLLIKSLMFNNLIVAPFNKKTNPSKKDFKLSFASKKCSCGFMITDKNAIFQGIQDTFNKKDSYVLALFGCPNCHTTLCSKIEKEDL